MEKSIGEKVELKTYKPIGKRKEFEGVLKGFDQNSIIIIEETGDIDGSKDAKHIEGTEEKELVFARDDIAIIRLALDF